MRNLSVLVVFAALFVDVCPAPVSAHVIAQGQTGAQEKAASLRAQLTEVEAKQAELKTRLQTLEEELKPENIEKNLAGVGSTKPEDLREQRRKQLETERTGVQKQLDLLTTSHTRLETAVAQADADAYRQSAAPAAATVGASSSTATVAPATTTIPPKRPRRVRKRRARTKG